MIGEWLDEECVVVGAGATALRACVTCLDYGVNPLLVSKMPIGQSHSLIAEGGVNAALGTLDDDSWEEHLRDTVSSGHHLNDPTLAELLCREAPERLKDLQRYGANFPTDDRGKIAQSSAGSGGQHRKRVVAVSDFIGFVMQRTLLKRALTNGLRIMDDAFCAELLSVSRGGVGGLVVFDLRRQRFVGIRCSRVLLATGGAGQLYSSTTNTHDATGEGYVMAYDLGAELRDLEMVQFHPTALAAPRAARGLLVTEAARGIGGVLRNVHGERFMARYAEDEMELAPRDTVARGIRAEVRAGNGTAHEAVWLDLRDVPRALVESRLRNTQRLIRQYVGKDLSVAPIEVAPAAHHFMGGIAPRGSSMETVDGLFVAGEAAWGVHGANRLGGNALAETQVFGHLAALSMLDKDRGRVPSLPRSVKMSSPSLGERSPGCGRPESVAKIRGDLQRVMSRHVGLERRAQGLEEAMRELESLGERERAATTAPHFHGVPERIECRYMLRLASLVTQAAGLRRETRGAHVRTDFPAEDPCPRTTILSLDNPGALRERR